MGMRHGASPWANVAAAKERKSEMAFFQEENPSREPFLNAPLIVLALIGVLVAAHAARSFVSPELSRH